MSSRTGRALLAALAALAGATTSFVLTTAAMDTVADSVLIGLAVAVALVLVLLSQGNSVLSAIRASDRATLGLAAVGGALALWAAPLLVLSQRASDAPSGADTLFFTSSVWGLVCVAATFAVRSERPPITSLAGAVGAAAGAAGMLASWENPSSFSPFAKFPLREALMVTAGLLFAAGALALAAAARRAGAGFAASVGLTAATVLGLVSALPSLPSVAEIGRGALFSSVYLGVAVAVFALSWSHLSATVGVSRSSVSLFGVPVVVMTLAGVEQLTTVYGPNPIEWPGALAGAAVITACVVVVWLAEKPAFDSPAAKRQPLRVALGFAVTSAVLAVVSLATPALNASVEGGIGEPFQASWTMVGAESAAGWLAIAAAGLALASVIVARKSAAARSWVPAAVAVVVCDLAAIPLVGATLHTWNRWVPADVQQTYGTEYSQLLIEPRLELVRIAAMLLAVVAVGVVALSTRRSTATEPVFKEDVR